MERKGINIVNNLILGIVIGIVISLIFRRFKSITYHLSMLIRNIKKLFKL